MSHARLAPSNKCWPRCPGSIREQANYQDVAGVAAIDGTGTHLLIEMCLLNNCEPADYEGQIIGVNHEDSPNGWIVDQDRIDRAEVLFIYLKRRRKEYAEQFPGCGIEVMAEAKYHPGRLYERDDWYGTCDLSIVVRDGAGGIVAAEICDYKDGRMRVSENDNSQLQSYALGLLYQYRLGFHRDDTQIRMSIVQPKTKTPIRYQDVTLSELKQIGYKLNRAAEATDDPEAPLIADGKDGKGYCRWCAHRDNCPALADQKLGKLEIMNMTPTTNSSMFELLSATQDVIESLDSSKLAELLDVEDGVNATFKKVRETLDKRLNEGEDLSIYGYGKVSGKKSRVWAKGEEEIVKMLKGKRMKKAEIYPPKLASVAQIMKSTSLTEEQKEKIERDFVVEKYGPEKLGKVQRKEVTEVKSLFDQVHEPGTKPVISFFSSDL